MLISLWSKFLNFLNYFVSDPNNIIIMIIIISFDMDHVLKYITGTGIVIIIIINLFYIVECKKCRVTANVLLI